MIRRLLFATAVLALAVAVGVLLAVHGNDAVAAIIAASLLLMGWAVARVLGFDRR